MHIREGVGNRPTRRTHNSLKHTHNTHTLPVDDDEIIVNRNRLFFFFCHLTIQYIYILHILRDTPRCLSATHEPTTVYVHTVTV